jgi:hypothetical protein
MQINQLFEDLELIKGRPHKSIMLRFAPLFWSRLRQTLEPQIRIMLAFANVTTQLSHFSRSSHPQEMLPQRPSNKQGRQSSNMAAHHHEVGASLDAQS